MNVVVLNSGSPQPILRTLAIAKYCSVIRFIETGRRTGNHSLLEKAGIPVEIVPMSEPMSLPRLARRLRELSADQYVCHYAAGPHLISCLLAGKRPLAVVAMGNDILFEEGDRHVFLAERLAIKRAMMQVDYVSAKSRMLRTRLEQWRIPGRIDVNYWGLDHTVFSDGDKKVARERLGLPVSAKIILSMRAFEPRCNLNVIATAFTQLSRDFPDLHLVFIGNPTNPLCVEQVRNIIDSAGLGSHAHFRGNATVTEVVGFYRAADLGVSIASSEGFPNSVLEMLACKRPIVVGRIQQVEELLVDRQNAVLTDITPDSLGDSIRWLLDPVNSAHREQMVLAGFTMSKDVADINQNARRFVDGLGQMSGRSRPTLLFGLRLLLLIAALERRLFRSQA
jgi:glycosyltransferase involved in cell wall biosynthesis